MSLSLKFTFKSSKIIVHTHKTNAKVVETGKSQELADFMI